MLQAYAVLARRPVLGSYWHGQVGVHGGDDDSNGDDGEVDVAGHVRKLPRWTPRTTRPEAGRWPNTF